MSARSKTSTILRRTGLTSVGRAFRAAASHYPLLFIAVGFAIAVIGTSLYVSSTIQRKTTSGFDTAKVLPAPVSQPSSATTVYTADSIKQYDGKNGHRCLVAVNGTVYEISGKSLWQNGQHTPSDGQAYCGADLTEAIKHSPHGTSKLEELPKVGVYK